MVRADVHLHTTNSYDGVSDMMDMCAAALQAGLSTVCFTEHHDDPPEHVVDIPRYVREIRQAREAFPQLRVLRGIEAGYISGSTAPLLRAIDELAPDYILLACHEVDGVDPYYGGEYFRGRTRAQGSRAYLEAIWEGMCELRDWDALAHIGYVGRYAPPGETPRPLAYADAPDLIDRILRGLIEREKALEVNTNQLPIGGAPIPGEDCLRRYYQMGGRLVVLGSDAHGTGGIAAGFDKVAAMLRDIGFTSYAVYADRVREDWPL